MILRRTKADASDYRGDEALLVEIGRCSHWIRPKWKTDSGMTWPFGYDPTVFHTGGKQAWSFRSLPHFDWSLRWRIEPVSGVCGPAVRGQPTRRPLCHRICIPARTLRHPQATVHTIWTPGALRIPAQVDDVIWLQTNETGLAVLYRMGRRTSLEGVVNAFGSREEWVT